MDVTELLNVSSSNYTMSIILICLGAGLMLAGALLAKVKQPDTLTVPLWVGIPGLVLIMAGCLFGAFGYDSGKNERSTLFQSVLFKGYGFNIDRAADQWEEIEDAGENGVVTKVSREGDEQDVRIHLDGTWLVITGPDNKEIPTNP